LRNEQLTEIFNHIHQKQLSRKRRKIEAVFHPYRSLRHTIEWTPWRIRIKVSHHLETAPLIIIQSLAIILLSKVYSLKVAKDVHNTYRSFASQIEDKLPKRKTYGLGGYSSRGKVYNLNQIFDELNEEYFEPLLTRPVLGWSKNKSFTRLGFYDATRNLIVISRIFDDSRVPEKLVRYLIYHEMLHIYFPTIEKGNRRIIHSKEFKQTERQFPQYEVIQKWIKKNVRRLG
jgi:predicted metal-dependent hydrolase